MNEREQLMVLSYVDGELSGAELRAVEQLIAGNTHARALVAELKMSGVVLRENEPVVTLPVSKDYYWSQIAREIERSEARPQLSIWERLIQPSFWLRYVSPVAAVAAVTIVAVIGLQRQGTEGEEGDAPAPEASSVVFRNDAEKMTVIWLQTDDNSDFTDPDGQPKF